MAGSATLIGSAFSAASSSTIDVAVTLTAGRKLAIGIIGDDPGATPTVTAADTLGNTYTHRGNIVEAGIARRHFGLTCDVATGGSTTITLTYRSAGTATSVGNRQAYVYEVQDVGNFDAFGTQTDTGNNPTTAVAATNSAQPAFMLAAVLFYQGGTPTVGTIGGSAGVDEGLLFNGSGMLIGRGESQSIASVGSQSANFGNSVFDRSTTLLWIFLESAPPTISAHPSDQTVNDGATATFSVTATGGATPYTYQWQDNSSGSFADIGGATSSSYGPTAAYSMQGRQYRCVVTGANSLSVTSNAATLRVAYKLTGTGPRVYPGLGAPWAAGAFGTFEQGSAAAGGTHSTSGALAAQAAALAGTATHFTLHPTSGALSAQAAAIAGSATHLLLHTSTGALSAQAATIAGSAAHQHAATGALSAQAATVAGTANHATLHTSTGALSAQAATISGTAQHQHAATGALSAQAATIAGAADHTTAGASHSTSGALAAQDATLSGSAAHLTLHATSGALAAQDAAISGAAAHPHTTTGALSAQAAAIAGSANHSLLHTSSGALNAAAASISGAAAHEHAASGALAAQAATVAGAAVHSAAGVHIATGALQAGSAQIGGSAGHVSNAPDVTGGWGTYLPRRKKKKPEPEEAEVIEEAPEPEEQPTAMSVALRKAKISAERFADRAIEQMATQYARELAAQQAAQAESDRLIADMRRRRDDDELALLFILTARKRRTRQPA